MNRNGESGCPHLIPDLRGQLWAFHPEHDIRCDFLIDALYQAEEGPSYSCQLTIFIRKGCWIMCFSCVY